MMWFKNRPVHNIRGYVFESESPASLPDGALATEEADDVISLGTRIAGCLLFGLLALSLGASWWHEADTRQQYETLEREAEHVARRGQSRLRALAVTPDGLTLACGLEGGDIGLFRLPEGEKLDACLKHDGCVRALCFSPDGRFLLAGGGHTPRLLGELKVWDWRAGQLVAELATAAGVVQAVAFSPDGATLAASGTDGIVQFWHTGDFRSLGELRVGRSAVGALAFTRDGKGLIAGADNGQLSLWEITTRRRLAQQRAHEGVIWSVAVSPDGKLVASTGGDSRVGLSRVGTLDRLREPLSCLGHGRAVAFAPDGTMLYVAGSALGGPSEVRAWQLPAPAAPLRFAAAPSIIYTLVLDPQGRWLATGNAEGVIHFRHPQTGVILRTLRADE